jgi:hypothetical protein
MKSLRDKKNKNRMIVNHPISLFTIPYSKINIHLIHLYKLFFIFTGINSLNLLVLLD